LTYDLRRAFINHLNRADHFKMFRISPKSSLPTSVLPYLKRNSYFESVGLNPTPFSRPYHSRNGVYGFNALAWSKREEKLKEGS